MAFELWKNHVHIAHFIVMLIFTPLGVLVLALRFVATGRGGRKPALEDWFAVLATLFSTLMNVCSLMAITILNGQSIEEKVADAPADYRRMRQWNMSGLYMYFTHTLFVKWSVLVLLYRVFNIDKVYKIWIYIVAAAQAVLFVIFCVFQATSCKPFKRYFDQSIPGHCTSDGMTVLGGETPNSIIDFVMVALAILMIRPLHLSRVIKRRLMILFGLGFIVGIIGFIKIGITYSTSKLYAFSQVAIWTCVQNFVSLLCCCLPAIHNLLPASLLWGSVSSSQPQNYASTTWPNSRKTTGVNASVGQNELTPGPGQKGWQSLEDDSSARGLAWTEAVSPMTPHNDSHELNIFPKAHTNDSYPSRHGDA